MMYFDESLMKEGAGVGLFIVSPLGVHMSYMFHIHFPASNHVAEYEALINGLRIAIKLGIQRLEVRGNSRKSASWRTSSMASSSNEAADTLAKMASGQKPIPTDIFTSDQCKPSVCYEEPERVGNEQSVPGSGAQQPPTPSDLEVMELDGEPAVEPDPPSDWRMPYLNYLLREVHPTDKTEAR
jgi:hypothetical protein